MELLPFFQSSHLHVFTDGTSQDCVQRQNRCPPKLHTNPPHSARPLARNPVHWCCSSYPMRTPTRCNIGILQCSARHRSTSVRVWRSPTSPPGAGGPLPVHAPQRRRRRRFLPAPTSHGIGRAAHTVACWRVCRGGARSAFALCPFSAPPATAMSLKRGATAMPAVLPLRNHAQASVTLTRGIHVMLTARRGGADSAPGLRLAQLPPQHQSGCCMMYHHTRGAP